MPAGHRLELPWWIVRELLPRHMVRIAPTFLSTKAREAILADPISHNMRALCPSFYTIGLEIASFHDQYTASLIRDLLVTTFTARYQEIVAFALTYEPHACQQKYTTFTDFEQKLMSAGQCAMQSFLTWKSRSKRLIHSSELIKRPCAKRVHCS